MRAHAKINLCLSVCGNIGDMHLLDSVVARIGLFDQVTMSKRTDDKIVLRYKDKKDIFSHDNAYAMYELLQKTYQTSGADIFIEKNIPVGAGLGGSSADASAVARLFQKTFEIDSIPTDLLSKVGSDVPMQYQNGHCRMRGTGEIIEPVSLPKMFFALLIPKKRVSTKECYRLYDTIGGDNKKADLFLSDLQRKKEVTFFNALERSASTINEDIKKAKEILTNAGFSCGMSGSGSAVFGAEYEQEVFCEKLKNVAVPSDDFILLQTATEETV